MVGGLLFDDFGCYYGIYLMTFDNDPSHHKPYNSTAFYVVVVFAATVVVVVIVCVTVIYQTGHSCFVPAIAAVLRLQMKENHCSCQPNIPPVRRFRRV